MSSTGKPYDFFLQLSLVGVLIALPLMDLDAAARIARLTGDRFVSRDGLPLGVKYYADPTDQNVQFVVIGVHGISGAATDFDPLGEYLAANGVALVAWNLRSQGLDPRPQRRGDLADWQELVNDADDFYRLVKQAAGNKPVFICAESMGALIAINTAAQGRFENNAGLILLSPVVDLRGQKPPLWQRLLIRTLLDIAPWYRLNPATLAPKDSPPMRIAGDLEYQQQRQHSPHYINKYTFRFFRNLIAMTESARNSADKIDQSLLILYAGQDLFVAAEDVDSFFQQVPAPDKDSQLWPEAYHLLLFDQATPEVLQRIGEWIKERG